ncbi:MAG: AAA family ATPase [Sulfurimonas sp.]|jgi:MoxR-like ATPase
MNIREKTTIIINELNAKLIEREHVVPIILLTLFSRSHMLLLGPPGVGKTYAIELIRYFIKELKYFEYLITNNTTLDELFGTKVVDADGNMVYNIEHSMLDSHLCFVDELYKAPSSLTNSLLGITHSSRSFYQRGRGKLKSPMISMFAASNELPENDTADAFDDRILLRFWIDEIKDTENFKRFAKRDFDMTKKFSVSFDLTELADINEESKKIFIHDDFVAIYSDIRTKLGTEKVRISDRKLQSSLDIFQASAYINGRAQVELSELFLLLDIAWKHHDDIDRVRRIVFDLIFGNPSNVLDVLKSNQDSYKVIQSQLRGQVGNVLNYSYNFHGVNAESEFIQNRDFIQQICDNTQVVNSNCNSIKDNYAFAITMERAIEENIFLMNYKNHVYHSEDSVGEKRVNKDDVFTLSSDVSMLMNKLTAWLDKTTGLYEYNNEKIDRK